MLSEICKNSVLQYELGCFGRSFHWVAPIGRSGVLVVPNSQRCSFQGNWKLVIEAKLQKKTKVRTREVCIWILLYFKMKKDNNQLTKEKYLEFYWYVSLFCFTTNDILHSSVNLRSKIRNFLCLSRHTYPIRIVVLEILFQ